MNPRSATTVWSGILLMACPILFLSSASVRAQDTCAGGSANGNDVYSEWKLECECGSTEKGTGVDFQSYNEDYDINGWYISITTFDTLNCQRHGSSKRDIDGYASNGEVAYDGSVKVGVTHYLDTTEDPCPNTMGMRHVVWYCDPAKAGVALDEPSDGAASASTSDGAPAHRWKIDAPGGGPGAWTHHFTLFNDEPVGGDNLYISSIKFHPASVLYNDPATQINWTNVPVVTGPPLIRPPQATWTYDFITTGTNYPSYIYLQFTGTHQNGSALFVCTGRHATFYPHIPAVSEWGLAVLTLLVIAAATVVLRRRRATLA